MQVSIIIPCHNYAKYLAKALQSTSNQTYPPHEVIVVNDCSTDDTAQVAAQFPVIYLETNVGNGASARSVGLAHATGDAIALLDADNELYPTFLAQHVAALNADPGAAWSYSDRYVCREEGSIWYPFAGGHLPAGPFSIERLAISNYIDACTVIRRGALAEIGDEFPVEPIAADYALWLTLVENGWHGIYVAEPLFLYRVHATNNSVNNRMYSYSRTIPTPAVPLIDYVPESIRDRHQRTKTFWRAYDNAGAVHVWWNVPRVSSGKMVTLQLYAAPYSSHEVSDVRFVIGMDSPVLELESYRSLNTKIPNARVFLHKAGGSMFVAGLRQVSPCREPGHEAGIEFSFRVRSVAGSNVLLMVSPWWLGCRGVTSGQSSAVLLRLPPKAG
jgi:glycosyltransferase involved in cell wall biosynthesis